MSDFYVEYDNPHSVPEACSASIFTNGTTSSASLTSLDELTMSCNGCTISITLQLYPKSKHFPMLAIQELLHGLSIIEQWFRKAEVCVSLK